MKLLSITAVVFGLLADASPLQTRSDEGTTECKLGPVEVWGRPLGRILSDTYYATQSNNGSNGCFHNDLGDTIIFPVDQRGGFIVQLSPRTASAAAWVFQTLSSIWHF